MSILFILLFIALVLFLLWLLMRNKKKPVSGQSNPQKVSSTQNRGSNEVNNGEEKKEPSKPMPMPANVIKGVDGEDWEEPKGKEIKKLPPRVSNIKKEEDNSEKNTSNVKVTRNFIRPRDLK